jgi:UDP-N-acetylmuramyl tripeptide synthase
VQLIDSRRLTGPNLVWDHPGALLEVAFDGALDGARFIDLWEEEIVELGAMLGFPELDIAVLRHVEGAWLVVGGPIDQLYGLIEASELAYSRAVERLEGSQPRTPDLSAVIAALDEERNPSLIALQHEATRRDVTFLWDDDDVSLGMGTGSGSWPRTNLPDASSLDWSTYHDVPVAVVTGTNGKSTNIRLLRHIMLLWGKTCGSTSTDWIRVNEDILDEGDYSGPGGARAILRDPRVEIALLESARGGLLRRGCGVQRADVAAVLNVAEDHMGQYGINSVQDLIDAKLIVRRLVADGGLLVLNADDGGLVAASRSFPKQRVSWFSLSAPRVDSGESFCFVKDGSIVWSNAESEIEIANVDDIPITLGGKAAYNVANVLSATAIAVGLAVPTKTIGEGLRTFESDFKSNPGRSNYFEMGGYRVLLDYAHNPHGLKAVLETTSQLGAERSVMTLSTAGDRTEKEIRELAALAYEYGVDKIIVSDVVGYERELGVGGVRSILADEFKNLGKPAIEAQSELEAVRLALEMALPGDLLVLLVKAQRTESLELIQSAVERNT